MKLSLFDYDLPEELIAQYPLEKRDESRLMVLNRQTKSIQHSKFLELHSFLESGDLLVLNNTKVIPARLIGRKERSGGKVEILLISPKGEGLWEALVKHSSRMSIGTKVIFGKGEYIARIMDKTESQGRLIQFENENEVKDLLNKYGKPPLPPYVKRETDEEDKKRYQTIYAKYNGAIAAPTAGLHFTESVFNKLKSKGIEIVEITLHVGLGTFQPVKVENIEEHEIHSEYLTVNPDTAQRINQTKAEGGKIVAVGTTSVRALESASDENGIIKPYSGFTNIFIYPGYKFRIVDKLITNFHLPKSTLIMLVSAFAGRDFIMSAYNEAIKERYRFYSYGDAMLII